MQTTRKRRQEIAEVVAVLEEIHLPVNIIMKLLFIKQYVYENVTIKDN